MPLRARALAALGAATALLQPRPLDAQGSWSSALEPEPEPPNHVWGAAANWSYTHAIPCVPAGSPRCVQVGRHYVGSGAPEPQPPGPPPPPPPAGATGPRCEFGLALGSAAGAAAALLVALLMVGLQPEPLVGSDVDTDTVPSSTGRAQLTVSALVLVGALVLLLCIEQSELEIDSFWAHVLAAALLTLGAVSFALLLMARASHRLPRSCGWPTIVLIAAAVCLLFLLSAETMRVSVPPDCAKFSRTDLVQEGWRWAGFRVGCMVGGAAAMASAVLLNLGWPPRSHEHSPVARNDQDDEDHEKRTLIQPRPQPEPEPEPQPEPQPDVRIEVNHEHAWGPDGQPIALDQSVDYMPSPVLPHNDLRSSPGRESVPEVGQEYEVYSKSGGDWVTAKVEQVFEWGVVRVSYRGVGERDGVRMMKSLAFDQLGRQGASGGGSRSRSPSPSPTARSPMRMVGSV